METFKEAYDVLSRHAETLRDQREPNIDELLTIVTESVAAYKVCQQRIEAVDKALEKALSDAAVPAATESRPASSGEAAAARPRSPAPSRPPASRSTGGEDDIPF